VAALAFAALSLILAAAALAAGGIAPPDLYLALLALAFLTAYYGLRARSFAPPPGRGLRWLLVALPVLFAVQILPLPRWLAHGLSPARVELDEAAARVVGASGSVTLSAAPTATLTALATLTGCVLILLVVRELAWRFDRRPWLLAAPLIVLAALEAALALAQPLACGTFVNRNHFASLLAACLPFPLAWGLALVARNLREREIPALPLAGACALFSLTALLVTAVVRSSSRAGFLAALLALVVTVAAAVRGRRAALAVALVASAAFLLLPSDALILRYAELASGDVSNGTRLELWRETAPLIRDYAVTGCGLGAYAPVMTHYKTVAPLHTVDFAHNEYVQLLAEGGFAGFLPTLAAALLVLLAAARATGGARGGDRAYRSAACLAALTALLFHALFDFNLHIPVNAMAAAWIAGLATAPE
jgi:hypothetical protein